MTNQTIKQILKEKSVFHLYHANTVPTSCTFLEHHGLLSRGAVEDYHLFQSPQASDETDKLVDVFYDIFFDSVDVHRKRKNLNFYGPVLFVYSIDLIDTLPEGAIRITKDNPIRWTPNMPEQEKYFLLEDELRSAFKKGTFCQHITLRHQKKPVPFDHLETIILDDPGVDNPTYFQLAHRHLQSLLTKYAPNCTLEVRTCPPDCRCQQQYRAYKPSAIYYKFRF